MNLEPHLRDPIPPAVRFADPTLRQTIGLGERFRRWRFHHRQAFEGWLILTPILLYFSFFFLFPVVSSLVLSFTRWSGLSGSPTWVGFGNYVRYFTDSTYRQVIFNTVLFAVSILLLQTGIATQSSQNGFPNGSKP